MQNPKTLARLTAVFYCVTSRYKSLELTLAIGATLQPSPCPVKKPQDAGARPQAMCVVKSITSSTSDGPRASLPNGPDVPAHQYPASVCGPLGPFGFAQPPCAPWWPRRWPACLPASLGRCSNRRAACSVRWAGPWPCRGGQCYERGHRIAFWLSCSPRLVLVCGTVLRKRGTIH